MKVLIVGSGLGGLCCAIACRRGGLEVLVIEQAKELSEIGAGIKLPPNAARIMDKFGLMDKLHQAGAVELDSYTAMDYHTGEVIVTRQGKEWARKHYGYSEYAIHRAAYQDVLFKEAVRLGAEFRFGARAVDVRFHDGPSVTIETGEELFADAIIGADGINSRLRSLVLGEERKQSPAGQIAYRATISRDELSRDATLFDRFKNPGTLIWWGPGKHAVFYPIKACQEFNLVLLCRDDLPENVRNKPAELEEMWELFDDWDPTLRAIISQTKSVRKWKLEHMEELDTWTKGHVALLGDACHPTLPYQAQGAAMAVEDGAILGMLLSQPGDCSVVETLAFYEKLRKDRTTLNVKGARQNKDLYQLSGEKECKERDEMLRSLDSEDPMQECPWFWGDNRYQGSLLGDDVLQLAERAFQAAH